MTDTGRMMIVISCDANEFYWSIIDARGQMVAESRPYPTHKTAENSAKRVFYSFGDQYEEYDWKEVVRDET